MRTGYTSQEVLETIRMVQMEKLDIRTITMGISLRDCAHQELKHAARRVYDKVCRRAENLVAIGGQLAREFGVPIVNQRISVTPVAMVAEASDGDDYVILAEALDRAAKEVGVNFLGGYSALVQKGMTPADEKLIRSIPDALAVTERLCSSVNIGSTKAGINMDAVALMGHIIKAAAEKTADRDAIGCAKLVVSATPSTTTRSWPAPSTASANPTPSSMWA